MNVEEIGGFFQPWCDWTDLPYGHAGELWPVAELVEPAV